LYPGLLKEGLARFLERLGLDPIILHERANSGHAVIEKIERHSDVTFAVVLLSPDDEGRLREGADSLRPRARQNVVFELGYFLAKLGRGKVCALLKGEVEIMSDYQGILYVSVDASESWKLALARELRAANIEVHLNRAL
jgi:predicted nucleotide-binding protein